ncbi:hypothetical protein JCM11491_006752 [Sporobolomyces phaffii]
MATRPFTDCDLFDHQLPSPSLELADVAHFHRSSINSDLLPFTPPPSVPTSSPSSPEYRTKDLPGGGGGKRARKYGMTPMSLPNAVKVDRPGELPSGTKSWTEMKPSSLTDHVEVSALPEGYGDSEAAPILPRTRISFPAVFSDESADETASVPRLQERPNKTPRRRVVSQETVVTTNTTRKLERRKIRYSASILDEMQDEDLETLLNDNKAATRKGGRTSSPYRLDQLSRNAGSPTSSRSSRPGRASTSSPRRSSSQRRTKDHPSSLAPSSLRSSSTPRRRRKSSSASKAPRSSLPSTLIVHPDRAPLRPSASAFIYDDDGEQDDPDYPLSLSPTFSDLTTTTIPLFRPVVNMFTFLLVSSFCCMTVSAVLVASFGCTLYDDCGRRWSGLNRSLRAGSKSIKGGIGGVKEGMERVLGNARGAIESAVKATEMTREDGAIAGSSARSSGRTAMPTATVDDQDDEGDYGDVGRGKGKDKARKRSNSRSESTSRQRSSPAPSARKQGWRSRPSPGPSTLRRTLNPFSAFSSPPSPAESSPSSPAGHKSGWATDEDALPFDVPHPTPRTSRPASPHRSPRSRTSTNDSSTSSTSSNLPPRPHLAVLLPSLFIAVVLTLAKLGYSFYKESTERELNRQRAERRRGRTSAASYSY